jgi:hypothetical protein
MKYIEVCTKNKISKYRISVSMVLLCKSEQKNICGVNEWNKKNSVIPVNYYIFHVLAIYTCKECHKTESL